MEVVARSRSSACRNTMLRKGVEDAFCDAVCDGAADARSWQGPRGASSRASAGRMAVSWSTVRRRSFGIVSPQRAIYRLSSPSEPRRIPCGMDFVCPEQDPACDDRRDARIVDLAVI